MDSRWLQSQRNGIKDNNNIKLPLVHIRKMQNTSDIGTTASTKAVIGIRKMSRIIG